MLIVDMYRSRCCLSILLLESNQVLAQLLDTLLVIGTQLPDNIAVTQRLFEMACKVRGFLLFLNRTFTSIPFRLQ